ncbi:hypothetical protein ACFLTO_01925 [Chloroflexota bacterium]
MADEIEKPSSRSGRAESFGPLKAGKYTAEAEIIDYNSGETVT